MSNPLLNLPIPKLNSSQIDRFNRETLKSDFILDFDIQKALAMLINDEKVGAVDIGGTKLVAQIFQIQNKAFGNIGSPYEYRNRDGEGYLKFLKKIAPNLADLPIGISFAGTVKDNILFGGYSNLSKLRLDLAEYHDDFRNVLPSVKSVVNDAVAGIITASLYAQRQSLPKNVIYIISGTGLGGAVLLEDKIYSAEPGHIEVEPELNIFHQTEKCVDGDYICTEKAGGGGLGVEWIYENEIGQRLSGEEISKKFQGGDDLAIKIYDNTANIIAHTVLGLKKAFGLGIEDMTLALHGGTFKVPGLIERITQILESQQFLGDKVQILTMDTYSQNACLEGAAIAALMD